MPNAGIHGTRSTSWKSADAGSNHTQIASVMAKATSEKPGASRRISASRRPSALPINSSRIAAASGTTQESVSSIELPSSPQVIAEHDDDADEQRAGVGAHRSGLQAAQRRGAGADDGGGAVDRAVDDPHVEAAPQPFLRHDADR